MAPITPVLMYYIIEGDNLARRTLMPITPVLMERTNNLKIQCLKSPFTIFVYTRHLNSLMPWYDLAQAVYINNVWPSAICSNKSPQHSRYYQQKGHVCASDINSSGPHDLQDTTFPSRPSTHDLPVTTFQTPYNTNKWWCFRPRLNWANTVQYSPL